MITTTVSAVNGIIGSPLTLSCTSEGSPPDTFTWMKDGMLLTPTPSITAVAHDDTTATFRSDYTINSVTTSDNGNYTCTVTNPIGSDSFNITVNGKELSQAVQYELGNQKNSRPIFAPGTPTAGCECTLEMRKQSRLIKLLIKTRQ